MVSLSSSDLDGFICFTWNLILCRICWCRLKCNTRRFISQRNRQITVAVDVCTLKCFVIRQRGEGCLFRVIFLRTIFLEISTRFTILDKKFCRKKKLLKKISPLAINQLFLYVSLMNSKIFCSILNQEFLKKSKILPCLPVAINESSDKKMCFLVSTR